MGFGFNPIDVGRSLVETVDVVKDEVVETTVDVTSNVINSDAAELAFNAFTFQGQLARVGLERTLDLAGDGVDLAGDIFEGGRDLVAAGFDRATHPGDPDPPAAQGLTFAETKSAAELAYQRNDLAVGDVYEFPDGGQWRVADIEDDPQTGFRAVALQSVDAEDDRTIVAFSGSDEGGDWDDNLMQGAGLSTAQYDQAVAFANEWKEREGDNVILTGHSLGGGLASYAAIQTDLHATAVNSAPLALNHLGLDPTDALRITQYYVPGEALSVVNDANPLDIRPGVNIAVQGRDSILDPRSIGSNHSLANVAPDIPAPTFVGNYN